MNHMRTQLAALAIFAGFATAASAQTDINIDFQGDTVAGGDLVLTEPGTGPTDDFASDRFDELSTASFEIQNIASVGTLTVTATALRDDLNALSGGLADGSGGHDQTGEGTSFVFDRDVTITSIDFGSFTSAGNDEVTLSNGSTVVGTFAEGDISGSTDFSSTNPATMSIDVASGDDFEIAYSNGDYLIESIGMNVVPEPGNYALACGAIALIWVMHRRRSRR